MEDPIDPEIYDDGWKVVILVAFGFDDSEEEIDQGAEIEERAMEPFIFHEDEQRLKNLKGNH